MAATAAIQPALCNPELKSRPGTEAGAVAKETGALKKDLGELVGIRPWQVQFPIC